jgi:hypothetical protein
MQKCLKCGHENKDSDHYCQKCGARVSTVLPGSKPSFQMAPIPMEEASIGWNFPLGEVSFLNQNEAVEILRLPNVQIRWGNGKMALNAKDSQIQIIFGFGVFLTAVILHQIWRYYQGSVSFHLPAYAIAIAGFCYFFILVLLVIAAYRIPSVVFNCQSQTVEFLAGKRCRYKVAKNEVGNLLTRVVQRTWNNSVSGATKSWTAWSLYLQLKNGQEIPVVELDSKAESDILYHEIQKVFFQNSKV